VKYNDSDLDEILKYFSYCEQSGKIFWKLRPVTCVRIGDEAGFVEPQGYRVIGFKYKYRKAHRIAWAIHYGAWPDGEIDHIDGDRANNRIENLRCVQRSENMKNKKRRSDNPSGHTGVSWHSGSKKWRVRIASKNGKRHVGLFNSKSEAIEAARVVHAQNGYSVRHQNSQES